MTEAIASRIGRALSVRVPTRPTLMTIPPRSSTGARRGFVLPIFLVLLFAAIGWAQGDQRFRFAVLGHIRGDPHSGQAQNPLMAEFLETAKAERVSTLVLTGDIIWGDYDTNPTRREVVVGEWEAIDRSVAALGVPVFRVPGNHDINDLVTRDVWNERYPKLPYAHRDQGCLFLFLASGFVPRDGDSRKSPTVHGQPLDRDEIAFLERELASSKEEHVFLFLHHVLWWEDSAPWWRAVHPVLAKDGRVRAVFAGDFGPRKFSKTTRDRIHYVQSSIETDPNPEILRIDERSRLLAEQLDTFVIVSVDAREVSYDVRTLGAMKTERHSPAGWHAVHSLDLLDRVRYETYGGTAWKQKLSLLLAGVGFLAGVILSIIILLIWRSMRRLRGRS